MLVLCRRFGREETFYASGEVVVSAGSIGTPQILMLSGITTGWPLIFTRSVIIVDICWSEREDRGHIDIDHRRAEGGGQRSFSPPLFDIFFTERLDFYQYSPPPPLQSLPPYEFLCTPLILIFNMAVLHHLGART